MNDDTETLTYLGVDIGGSALKIGLVTGAGKILRREEYPVNFDGYKTPIVQTLLRRTRDFLEHLPEKPCGAGIAAAGQIHAAMGMVTSTCGNLPDWEGAPLRALMEDALGLPVTVMNDAHCAMLGEQWLGHARGLNQVVLITLGTGVGGSVLSDGRILRGNERLAGEVGHMLLHSGGIPCTCGLLGCYEQYASVTALLRRVQEIPHAPLDGRAVFERAAQGDAGVNRILSAWIADVAAGLISLVHLLNPELLLVGGGVSAQAALLIEPLREKVLASVMPRYRQGLRLEGAALGNEAGLIGAVRFFQTRQSRSSA